MNIETEIYYNIYYGVKDILWDVLTENVSDHVYVAVDYVVNCNIVSLIKNPILDNMWCDNIYTFINDFKY